MAVNLERAIQTVSLEKYREEIDDSLKPNILIPGFDYIARLILNPKRTSIHRQELQYTESEIGCFAADVPVSITEKTTAKPSKYITSRPIGTFGYKITTSLIGHDDELGSKDEHKNYLVNAEGVMYDLGLVNAILFRRDHAEIGYFPVENSGDVIGQLEHDVPVPDPDLAPSGV
ncbi:MAG TPA: hypothetical protein VK534_00580 [Methylomirabilota bacterium]|nr:hypothetical protein [Methylomirabilota bacterium]